MLNISSSGLRSVAKNTSSVLLPCPLIREAVNLHIDPDSVPEGALVTAPPYNAMKAGDKVTFHFYASESYTSTKILSDQDIGKPVQWTLPYVKLAFNEGEQATIHYDITYADTLSAGSDSAEQTLFIDDETTDLLPAVTFDNLSGCEINPGQFSNGLIVSTPWWDEANPQTIVALYLSSSSLNKKATLIQDLDISNIHRQQVTFHIPQSTLNQFINDTVDIACQFSNPGMSASSERQSFKIVKPLNLPEPVFESQHVSPGYTGTGSSEALKLSNGLPVSIPATAETGGYSVEMCCEGEMPAQSFVIRTQESGIFIFPVAMVAANMNRECDIFYRIVHTDGLPIQESVRFSLRIKKIPAKQFPVAECQYAKNQELSLKQIPGESVGITLQRWGFMAPGQLVTIIISGVSLSGKNVTQVVMDAHPVTASENGMAVVGTVNKSIFLQLKLYESFSIQSRVSFDQGESFLPFQSANITLTS